MHNVKALFRNTNETCLSFREKKQEDKEDEANLKMQVKLLLIATNTNKFY